MNDLILPADGLTMSSREIADLVGARHNDVIATIERLFGKGVLRESRKTPRLYAPPGGGRPTAVFDLTKRDSLVVAAGYNDEMRARIIDRWQELEARAVPATMFVVPKTLSEALRLAADQADRADRAEQQLVAQAPKVEFAETVRNMEAGLTMLQMAKLIGWGRNKLMATMRENGILTPHNVPYQKYIDRGYFTVAESTVKRTGGVVPVLSTLVTGAGQVFLQRKFAGQAAA